jgi:hypothetical protein
MLRPLVLGDVVTTVAILSAGCIEMDLTGAYGDEDYVASESGLATAASP